MAVIGNVDRSYAKNLLSFQEPCQSDGCLLNHYEMVFSLILLTCGEYMPSN